MEKRFQFSIRLMLVATAVVASALWGTNAKSSGVAIAVVFALSIVFASISVLAYTLTSGTLKAFWLGIAVPIGIQAIAAVLLLALVFRGKTRPVEVLMDDSFTSVSFQTTASVVWCFAPINGLICALVHRLFWPRQRESDLAAENQISK